MSNVIVGSPTVLLYSGCTPNAIPDGVVRVGRVDLSHRGEGPMVLVPLFTGAEAVERFLAASGESGKGMTPLQLSGFDELERLLAALEKAGTTHVHFNAVPGGPSPDPVPIAEVLDSLRHRPR